MLVHIIDDDEGVRRTLAQYAARGGWESALFSSAAAFLAQEGDMRFGPIVCDIKMPDMNGLDLLKILQERYAEWPVIMITGYGDVTAAIESFRTGAVHFLQKPVKRDRFLAALDEAAQVGERRQLESAWQQKALALRKLSEREMEVLKALAEGLQSKNIAFELGISVRTVEMYRSNILAKLEIRNISQAVAMLQMAAASDPSVLPGNGLSAKGA